MTKKVQEVSQAVDRLKELLLEDNFDLSTPNPNLGWEVFKRYSIEPYNCADDSIHIQFGVLEQAGIEKYKITFSRQFEINDDEKFYDHLEVVRMIFTSQLVDDLRQYQASLSTVGFRSLEAFFTAIENLPAFQATLATNTIWQCEIRNWKPGIS